MERANALTSLLLTTVGATGIATAQEYEVIDLGSLDGSTSFGWAINDRGDATGWSGTSGQYDEAFLWTEASGMIGLGTLFGLNASYGLGVNDARTVAGYSGLAFEDTQSFIRRTGQGLVNIGTLGGAEAWARDINNNGQIVGESLTATGERHLFLWRSGTMQDIGTPPRDAAADADAIGDAGHIAGSGSGPFIWRNGTFTPLPSLGGLSLPRDVNIRGHAVGSSALGTGGCFTCDTRAALWRDGVVHNLGMLAPPGTPFMTSTANAINNAGQIVGYSTTAPGGSHHAFICEDDCAGGPQDLNALVPAGWSIYEAYAINDAGEIVAVGSGVSGFQRALLLRPVDPALVLINPQPGRAGAVNQLAARNAASGANVAYYYGLSLGSSALAACDLTLDIAAARRLGVARADVEGNALLVRQIPPALAGRIAYLQIVDLTTCETSAIGAQLF